MHEVALIDVREEAPFAESHPLFAANIPLSKLELEVYSRIPRRDTQVTVYDNGEGLASRAAERLIALGYTAGQPARRRPQRLAQRRWRAVH